MKGITIRFGDTTYELLKSEARQEGVSLSSYIREAAFGRAVAAKARRGDYGTIDDNELLEAARAFMERERQNRLTGS